MIWNFDTVKSLMHPEFELLDHGYTWNIYYSADRIPDILDHQRICDVVIGSFNSKRIELVINGIVKRWDPSLDDETIFAEVKALSFKAVELCLIRMYLRHELVKAGLSIVNSGILDGTFLFFDTPGIRMTYNFEDGMAIMRGNVLTNVAEGIALNDPEFFSKFVSLATSYIGSSKQRKFDRA